MAAGKNFRIKGLKELEDALKQLPKATSKSILRKALKKGGQLIAVSAAVGAPRDRGDLAGSIEVRPMLSRRQRKGRAKRPGVTMYIGPTFPKGSHGHLVEFGTAFMAARPFLRPAWDSNLKRSVVIIRRESWAAIRRIAKRSAAKAPRRKL